MGESVSGVRFAGAGTRSSPSLARLTSFVKAYDIRGLVGTQLTSDVSRAIGYRVRQVRRRPESPAVVIAYDMRESSPELAGAFAEGVTGAGLDVVMAGLASTDLLYFASGSLQPAGRDVHRVAQPGQVQRHQDVPGRRGADQPGHRAGPGAGRRPGDPGRRRPGSPPTRRGTVTERNLLADYADYLRSLVDLSGIRPLHVVVDAGNGMAGYTVPGGVRRAAAAHRGAVLRARRHVSPTTRRTRWSRPTWSTCSRRSAAPAPTSGWPSTVTPTAVSSSTSGASRSRPARSPRWSPAGNCAGTRARPSCTT